MLSMQFAKPCKQPILLWLQMLSVLNKNSKHGNTFSARRMKLLVILLFTSLKSRIWGLVNIFHIVKSSSPELRRLRSISRGCE
eukprot:UN13151